MAKKLFTHSDIDLNFSRHPVTGDVSIKYDESAIKSSIKNLILTKNSERLFNGDLGININDLLFEHINPLVTATIKREIIYLITNNEPRVNNLSVEISQDIINNGISIFIKFSIIGKFEPVNMSVAFERTR